MTCIWYLSSISKYILVHNSILKLIWLRIEHSSSSIFSGKTLVNLTLRIWEESLRASWRGRWLLHLKQIPPNGKMYQSKRWDALLLGILVVLLVCHQLRFCHPPVRLEANFSSTIRRLATGCRPPPQLFQMDRRIENFWNQILLFFSSDEIYF